EPRTLKMIRGVVPFTTALGFRRTGEESWDYHAEDSGPIAYVRITSITVSSLHELRQIERQLQQEGFKALVLDLRSAGGDDVQFAALLTDGLLDGGLMWTVRDAQGKLKAYQADRDSPLTWNSITSCLSRTVGVSNRIMRSA